MREKKGQRAFLKIHTIDLRIEKFILEILEKRAGKYLAATKRQPKMIMAIFIMKFQ